MTNLESQKMDILTRLIKADQISLSEALILLETEEQPEQIVAPPQQVAPWPNWQWPVTVGNPVITPLSGTITTIPPSSIVFTNTTDNTIYKA